MSHIGQILHFEVCKTVNNNNRVVRLNNVVYSRIQVNVNDACKGVSDTSNSVSDTCKGGSQIYNSQMEE